MKSNLSLATSLLCWKVSLEPWKWTETPLCIVLDNRSTTILYILSEINYLPSVNWREVGDGGGWGSFVPSPIAVTGTSIPETHSSPYSYPVPMYLILGWTGDWIQVKCKRLGMRVPKLQFRDHCGHPTHLLSHKKKMPAFLLHFQLNQKFHLSPIP